MHHLCHPNCNHPRSMTRRDFLSAATVAAAAMAFPYVSRGQAPAADPTLQADGAPRPGGPPHRCIDIHAHQSPDSRRGAATAAAKKGKSETATASAARTEAQFVAHQKAINALGSVILGGNFDEYEFIKANPDRYIRSASGGNVPSGDRAAAVETALKGGAKCIGEHRWEGESEPYMQRLLDMARDFKVPILFHFQEANYPKAPYREFYKTIEKYPTVTFIGHAIDWWGSIDKNYDSKAGTYPRGRVTPGGLTDVWLSRYPNLHCDLSATSGNTGLLRDPDFAKDFVNRQQDKIMFGTDCPCTTGNTPSCWAVIKHVAIAQLQLSPAVLDKIYFGNAQKVFGIKIA
jgi:predicted TIM-barrel fold metal-dependent hydrolase